MSEKNIKSRVIHKHDVEAHWQLATNFIPKQGELIVYDIDDTYGYERFKIGDGITLVSDLPFALDAVASKLPVIITVVQSETGYSANKTYEEIINLLNNNCLYCRYNDKYYNLMVFNDTYTVFNTFNATGSVLDYEWIVFRPDGTVSVTNASHDLSIIITEAHTYTDTSIANLVNSAPETLDTLGELATALQENEDVVSVLNEAITTRVKTVNGIGVDSNGNVEVREVPEVTETDNGKFLVVVNGVWTAVSIENAEEVSF